MTDEIEPEEKVETTDVGGTVEELEVVPASPEAIAAANAALENIADRPFAKRHPELGKMVKCQFCNSRHRQNDNSRSDGPCKQTFKQMWVDEDPDTGKLEIQYATVPLPGQNPTAKAVLGAAAFHKKRKTPRPNHYGLELVQLTRKIFARINPERFPEEAGRMLEAKRIARNTIANKRERKAKKLRQQQRESRRINCG
jgi:hypothetical protein